MNILSRTWWRAAGERAIRTLAQTAVAMIGTTAVSLGDVDWVLVCSTAILAGVLSLLTSLTGLPEVEETSDE